MEMVADGGEPDGTVEQVVKWFDELDWWRFVLVEWEGLLSPDRVMEERWRVAGGRRLSHTAAG